MVTNPPSETVLESSAHRQVVRVGDTLRRTTYPWSGSVHLLLDHLESVGFPYSPRFLGIDPEGREVLSFIEGVSGAEGRDDSIEQGAHCWAMVVPEDGLARFARLLRDYHDAVADFVPPADASWAWRTGRPVEDEVVCHNDFGPWNSVWQQGSPVGIIDWDYAAPGRPLDDVAFALEWSVPFAPDWDCLRWRRFETPPDRVARIEVFAEAYGLASTDGLVDRVIAQQETFLAHVIELAERGIQPEADSLADGYAGEVEERIRWSKDHRHLLEQ